jgi:hypothetical protein
MTGYSSLTRKVRFAAHPGIDGSNVLSGTIAAENSMRPVAIGRKNWIHVGSPQAGPKIAAILSVAACPAQTVYGDVYTPDPLSSSQVAGVQCLKGQFPAGWTTTSVYPPGSAPTGCIELVVERTTQIPGPCL